MIRVDVIDDFPYSDSRVNKAGDRLRRAANHNAQPQQADLDVEGRQVEVQVRTRLQDVFAQSVERLDRSLGSDLKHGHGPADWLGWLQELSDQLRRADVGEPYEIPLSPLERGGEEEQRTS